MCIDTVLVDNVRLLTTTGHPLCYQKTVCSENEQEDTLHKGLDVSLRSHNSSGHRVKKVTCNNRFKKTFEEVSNNSDITMDHANPHAHKPHAEQNNRTTKNQVRTVLHRTTHKCIPRVMIKHLAVSSAEKITMFPSQCGISEYYSPETLVTGKVSNCNRHCKFEFGDCAQADNCNDPRNDMRPRCIDGICLRPAENDTGHCVMDLQTGRDAIRGGPMTVVPLTDAVKNRVEQMAEKQGHGKLKFKKKSRETILHEDILPVMD